MTALDDPPVAVVDDVPPAPATTVIAAAEGPPPRPRVLGGIQLGDVASLVGAACGGVALTALLFNWVLPFDGPAGFVIVSYVVALVLYVGVLTLEHSWEVVKDRFASVIVHSLALILLSSLILVVTFTAWRGRLALKHRNFYTEDLRFVGPQQDLTVGGIAHAAIGTFIMISIALVLTIPLGIATAVFLAEVPGRFSRFVRTIVEAMTALPSIVAGLFIYAALITGFNGEGGVLPPSGFAAALAISIMMLPIVIRSADVVLRLVPSTLKEASYATGASQWRTTWHVVLPTVKSGLATAVILATARGIGETSPVLLTAGFTTRFNFNPFEGPMVSLPLATFDLVKKPDEDLINRGFGAATVLFALVLILFVVARVIGGSGPGHQTARQRRKAARRSARDARRFEAPSGVHPAAPSTSSGAESVTP